MEINRRDFIKISGAAAAGIAVSNLGYDLGPVKAHAQMLKTRYGKETTTICCYCGVGCGAIVHTSKKGDGRVINIEGDPDHVINRGALCSKGAALAGLVENENRLLNPIYRAPYATEWQEVTWEWAIDRIGRRIKATRDATFTPANAAGQTVNRTTAIASVGSAAIDNEECWIYQALLRAMGRRWSHTSWRMPLWGCGPWQSPMDLISSPSRRFVVILSSHTTCWIFLQ